jgi:hypothetical protein
MGELMIGFGKRVSYAFRSFFALLGSGTIPDDVVRETAPDAVESAAPASLPAEKPAPPADSTDRAVQMLAILQRDGRLVDFLMEDIAAYSDDQVGAAVRAVHEGCRQALERYVAFEPILASNEGDSVTVQSGFDPAAIKLVGNVGAPPVRGTLNHRGWRASEVKLPPLPEQSGRAVVAPAEVEIG